MSTSLDVNQIAKQKFDEELRADRVHIVSADINVSLSAEDNDSVIIKTKAESLIVESGDILDLSLASQLNLLGAASATLSMSVNGSPLDVLTLTEKVPSNVCLTEVTITFAGGASALLVVK